MTDNVMVGICGPDGLCRLCAAEDQTGTDGCGSNFRIDSESRPGLDSTNSAGECPGCIGRGLGTACEMCNQPIPDHMQLRPGNAIGPNPALDGYAFNATIAALKKTHQAGATS